MSEPQPYPKDRHGESKGRGNRNPECATCRKRHKPGKCKGAVTPAVAIQVGPAKISIDDLFKEDGSPKPAPPMPGTAPGTTGESGENVGIRRARPGPIPFFIRPTLFVLASKRLNRLTDSRDFDLDPEEAEALAEGLVAALEYHKVETRPDFLFLLMLGMWLGPGILIHVGPRLKELWDSKFGDKGRKDSREEVRIPPPAKTPDPVAPVVVSPPPVTPDMPVTKEPGPPAPDKKDVSEGHAKRAADPRGFQPV